MLIREGHIKDMNMSLVNSKGISETKHISFQITILRCLDSSLGHNGNIFLTGVRAKEDILKHSYMLHWDKAKEIHKVTRMMYAVPQPASFLFNMVRNQAEH